MILFFLLLLSFQNRNNGPNIEEKPFLTYFKYAKKVHQVMGRLVL